MITKTAGVLALICLAFGASLVWASDPDSPVIASVGISTITYAQANIVPPVSPGTPTASASSDDQARLKRLILKDVTENVRQEIGVGVTDDDLKQIAVAETSSLGDLDWAVRQMHDHADQLDACLRGARAVYDSGDKPDGAFDKYVKGKAPRALWDTVLPAAKSQAQRDVYIKQIADERSVTVDQLRDPQKYRPLAMMRNTMLAVVRRIGRKNAAARAFADSIKPPTGIDDVLPVMPRDVQKAYDAWWRNQYRSAGIEIADRRFIGLYGELGLPAPPVKSAPPLPANVPSAAPVHPATPAASSPPAPAPVRPATPVAASPPAPAPAHPATPVAASPPAPAPVRPATPAASSPPIPAPVHPATPVASPSITAVKPATGAPDASGATMATIRSEGATPALPAAPLAKSHTDSQPSLPAAGQTVQPVANRVASSDAAPVGASDRRAPSAKVEFRWLQPVQSSLNPRARYRLISGLEGGSPVFSFHDNRTGQTFRDGAAIRAEFLGIVSHSSRGGRRFVVPAQLIAGTGLHPALLLDEGRRAKVVALAAEMRQYLGLLDASPTIDGAADISGAEARSDPGVKGAFVDLFLQSDGCVKLEAFSGRHAGAILAVIVDDKIVTASPITDQITGYQVELARTFESLDQARNLAAQINGTH